MSSFHDTVKLHLYFLLFITSSLVFLVFFPLRPKYSKTQALFAASLPDLSELQFVHFILRRVSDKINRSVSWETQASGFSKISKGETTWTKNRTNTQKKKYRCSWWHLTKVIFHHQMTWRDCFIVFLSPYLCSTWRVYTKGFALVLHQKSCPCLLILWLLNWIKI